jgi:hypothetical protein
MTIREMKVYMSDDWMDFAACKDEDTDLFFAPEDDKMSIAVAKSICEGCPVQEPCIEASQNFSYGVWGGLTATERYRMRRRIR